MTFDLKSFAAQVRPSPQRPEAFSDSVLDAGSPQYVRPEDLFLDIQARLFDLKPFWAKDLGGIDPADFRTRWIRQGASSLTLKKIGPVSGEQLVDSVMSLLKCSRRKKERYPTLLPMVPSLSHFKNIKPNLPNFLSDQFRPALAFADESGFSNRISILKSCLCDGTHADESMRQLAAALLPPPSPAAKLSSASFQVPPHDAPILRDFTTQPNKALAVCSSFGEAIDTLIALEARVPRLLWTRWLTATIRLWLPLFFLRRCAIGANAAQLAKTILAQRIVPTSSVVSGFMLGGGSILRGNREWLNQLSPIIQNYVRARLELSILLELSNLHEWMVTQSINPVDPAHSQKISRELDNFEVDPARPKYVPFPNGKGIFLNSAKLSMPGDSTRNDRLPFDAWLNWITKNRQSLDALARAIGANETADLVERVYAHVRPEYEPLRNGFGKNALEYVAFALGAPRKVDRDPEYPDEFNLLFRGEGGRRARQVQVQPGPQLLAMLVQFVSHKSSSKYNATAKLSDLLDLFETLGIDYRSNPEDFDGLRSDLLRLGLLRSSADAAEAASLNPAYSL